MAKLMHINEATAVDLKFIKGVGDVTAGKILHARDSVRGILTLEHFRSLGLPETVQSDMENLFNFATVYPPDNLNDDSLNQQLDEEDMKLAFEAFDENGDRLISREELRNFVSNVGEVLDEEEFEEMMEKIDCDGDGFIDYEEFVYMMAHGHAK